MLGLTLPQPRESPPPSNQTSRHMGAWPKDTHLCGIRASSEVCDDSTPLPFPLFPPFLCPMALKGGPSDRIFGLQDWPVSQTGFPSSVRL